MSRPVLSPSPLPPTSSRERIAALIQSALPTLATLERHGCKPLSAHVSKEGVTVWIDPPPAGAIRTYAYVAPLPEERDLPRTCRAVFGQVAVEWREDPPRGWEPPAPTRAQRARALRALTLGLGEPLDGRPADPHLAGWADAVAGGAQ